MRKRSTSIHANSAEEYFEKLKNSEEEEDQISQRRLRRNLNENDDKEALVVEADYLGVRNVPSVLLEEEERKNAEVEERELIEQLQSLNSVYQTNTTETMSKIIVENGMNLLCSYFKESIRKKSEEEEDSTLVLHSSVKKPVVRALSNNAIHDFDMRRALDTIRKEKEEDSCEEEKENLRHNKKWRFSQYSTSSSSSTGISKEVLAQNVKYEEEVMKVMLVGSTQIGKTKLINNFLETRKNKYIPSSGLEIKKKVIPIINKKVRIEFFDTDANFHLKETSRIYYKICDSFIYVVDCTKIDSFNYIKSVHSKIFDNSSSTTYVLVAINKNLISEDMNREINEYSKEYNISLFTVDNLDDFHMKTENVNHLFSAMLVKKMTKKTKSRFSRNGGRYSASCPTASNTPSIDGGFGFNENYQMESYNAFNDETIKTNLPLLPTVRRRWSFYDVASFK